MTNSPSLIVLRTHPENFDEVIRAQKHALDGRLKKANSGDILLVGRTGSGVVSHAMRFRSQRADTSGETERRWGRHWPFLIEGEDCCELARPFNPQQERVTQASRKDYGPGGSFFYVLDEDADVFRQRGLLLPLLPPLGAS
jgi:hypothetical protein